jgi:hypothetical protein
MGGEIGVRHHVTLNKCELGRQMLNWSMLNLEKELGASHSFHVSRIALPNVENTATTETIESWLLALVHVPLFHIPSSIAFITLRMLCCQQTSVSKVDAIPGGVNLYIPRPAHTTEKYSEVLYLRTSSNLLVDGRQTERIHPRVLLWKVEAMSR